MYRFEVHIEGQDPYIVESTHYDLSEDETLMPAVECTVKKLD